MVIEPGCHGMWAATRWEHRRWRIASEAFVDGELASDARSAVQCHLRKCWTCREHVELLRMIKVSLQRHPSRVAPIDAAWLRRTARSLAQPGAPGEQGPSR